jgi:hypothetical protein
MRFRTTGTSFLGDVPHARHHEAIEPGRAAAVLADQGMRPAVAQAIAHGELGTAAGAKRLARLAGLTIVETEDARRGGLLR